MHVVIILCFVPLSFAQAPVRCETPNQWEARRIKAVPSRKFQETGQYYYDAINEKTRAIEDIVFGAETEFYDVLHLYKENKEYRLNLMTKNCTVGVPPHPFFKVGIPDGSKFLFTAEAGPAQIPNEHLTIQNWQMTFTDGARYDISVTVPDCIPVNAAYFNTKQEYEFYTYFNIRPGIRSPSVFDIPSECAGL